MAFLIDGFRNPAKLILTAGFVFIILLFVIMKVPALAEWVSEVLRGWNGQSTSLASPSGFALAGVFIYCFPSFAYPP